MTETKISIYRDDVWAGDGRIVDTSIVDCPAILGPDQDASDVTYNMIDDAIEDGRNWVRRPDGIYTWIITDGE